MQNKEDLNESLRLISKQLGLASSSEVQSQEYMLDLIQQRVIELMEQNIELLMSYLYRLDVSEREVGAALNNETGESPSLTIAQLILNRQLERVRTKKKYIQKPIKDWDF